MKNKQLTAEFWDEKYKSNATGWYLGQVSPPIKEYIDQLEDKSLQILIPGAGFGLEANYLIEEGFYKTHLCDWSAKAITQFKIDFPDFPAENIHLKDFFKLEMKFDLILEQTFFCALLPSMRMDYVQKMYDLLNPDGKLVGLFFNRNFDESGPPFGGHKDEYVQLFSTLFKIKTMELCYNSVTPRKGKELFSIMQKY